MAEKKGLFKNIFGKKDDKPDVEAELEKAKKEAEAAKKAVKSLIDQKVEAQKEKSEEVKEAEKKAEELEAKMEEMKKEKAREELQEKREQLLKEREEKLAELKKAKEAIATHTVADGETLSHIALKYYKHATPPYWQLLLEHNTEVLNGSEKNVRTGMVLEIPELPEELKD